MTRLTTLGVALVVASLVFAGTAAAGFAVQTHASDAVQATDGTAASGSINCARSVASA